MNNSNKKYGMGGAVQSFSSPMLAQGMQGSLSGFGTSGLQTFADGGQTTTIQDILAKYKAMESAKAKQDPTTEFLNKSWEGKNIDDYVMYSDKFKRGGKMAHGGVIQHGLQEGDKIVKEVENKYLIVASKGGVYSVVDIEKGSRFIVGLDDSKTSGKRKSVKAGVKEAMEYINYLKSTKMANGGKFAEGGMLEDAKIYVADLAEYNNGKLVGKWLDLSDYSSGAEVMEAIQEMLDEQTKKDKFGDVHEEYAIHDFEGFPRSFYSEYMGESDFDQLYEIARVADDANLPLDVLMKAMSDLGYEDNPERVAEEYSSSIPASMGNEWRDFAYEWVDSVGIEGVSNIESYFDYEEFGSDIRMDYSEEELEEMGYDDLSDEELGERNVEEIGGVENLPKKTLEMYFDYAKLGRDLQYDYTAIRGNDGDFYFFNSNFAKGGQFKAKNFRKIEKIDYRGKDENIKEEKWKVLVVPDAFLEEKKMKSAYFNVYAEDEKHAKAFAIYLYSKKYNVSQEHLSIEIAQPYSHLNRFQIKNQYAGKTAEEIWNAMDFRQRKHFLKDHRVVCEVTMDEIKELYWLTWDELNDSPMKNNVVQAFTEHINEGQYAKGGTTKTAFKKGDKVVGQFRYEYGQGLQPVSLFDNGEKVSGVISNVKNIEGANLYYITFENGEILSYPDFAIGNFISKSQYAKGGEVANYYVVSAKENKVVSKGYSSEEDAKKEMYRLFEQTGDITYATRKMAKGGEVDESNMDIQFIEYGDYEIMYEPHYKKYYANDVEFDSLEKAKKFLDSGAVSSHTKGAYERGLFAKGGEVGDKMNREEILAYKKSNHIHYNPMNSRWQVTKDGKFKQFWNQEEAEKFAGFEFDDEKDSRFSRAEYEALFGYAKGGKIGFEGLAKKVAKRYVGRKVSKEYQAEYGKTYDAKEAKEVGNKVAGKVYKQQVAKKKIVRKLQRKTK